MIVIVQLRSDDIIKFGSHYYVILNLKINFFFLVLLKLLGITKFQRDERNGGELIFRKCY